ncbi:MAG: gliding motility-associated C-terminal domain-containing protein [Saprospiraceae bacterium]
MCKRIIPFALSLLFVVSAMAQDLRTSKINLRQGNNASPRVPCALNDVGGPITFGTVPRVDGQSNSTPGIGADIYLCANDSFDIFDIGNNASLLGDPDNTTQPGVGFAVYSCDPNSGANGTGIDGPDVATVLTDFCLLGNPMTSGELRVAIDFDDPFSGTTTFRNLGAPQATNNGEPEQWWFAPITFDGIVNDQFQYEGTPITGPCVSVDLTQSFSVVYLNPIEFLNVTTSFGGDGSRARLNLSGGLPEFDDTQTYTISIVNTADASVRGSVVSGDLNHRGFPIISVPEPGSYNISLSDGRGCGIDTTIVMDQFVVPDNPLNIITECPAGATVGQAFTIDVTTENFDSIIGGTFFMCWDTAVLEFIEVTNEIDGTWLFGETLVDAGALIPNFLSQDFTGGTTHPEGTILFSITFNPKAASPTGTTMIEFCTSDPRPGSNNPADIIIAANGGTTIDFPSDPENQCPPIIITDPNDISPIVPSDEIKNACPGENNGSFSIQVLGGMPPYEITWFDENGNPDGPIMINDQDGIATITNLAPGVYTYDVFDGGVGVDRRFKTDQGPITINEANLGVNAVSVSQPTCNGDNDGVMGVNVFLNSATITDLSGYSFIWIDNANGDTISMDEEATGLSTGNYQVIVTSNNGCSVMDPGGFLGQPAAMEVTPVQVMPTCSGVADGAIDVSDIAGGNGPFTFAWSDGNDDALNNNIVSGKYLYTVTDGGGCSVIDSIDLAAERELIINTQTLTNVQCFNFDNGRIDVSAGFSGPPPSGASTYDFVWSTNAPDIDNSVFRQSLAANLAPDTYSVTLTNSDLPGCLAVETFEITQPDSLLIDNIDITPLTSCNLPTPDGEATAMITGGTPLLEYEYVWSDTAGMVLQNTPTATGLDSGPIRLTVNDNNGCVTTKDTVIGTPPPPEVQFFEDVALNCSTDLGDLQVIAVPGRPGVTIQEYRWSHDINLNSPNANNVSPDTFIVTVIDTDQCMTMDTAIVSAPAPIQTSAIEFTEPCLAANDGAVSGNIIGGMPGMTGEAYNLEWTNVADNTPVGNNSILMDATAGDYVLSVVDANNCTFDTTITLNNIPRIAIAFDLANVTGVDCFDTVNPADCNGFASATAAYEGTGGGVFTFTWGATGESVTATDVFSSSSLCAGMQALSVSDGQCEVIDSVNIPSPDRLELDLANLVLSPADCFGDDNGSATVAAIGGTPGYTFQWPDGGNELAKTGLAASIYQITITDRNDCVATHDLEITQPAEPLMVNLNFDLTNDVICSGDQNGLITVVATGGNQTLNYTWTDNVSNGPSAAGLAPGPYTIDVADEKGCNASVTYTVATPAPITALIEWDPIQCNGFQTGIRVSALSGGNGNDYSFSVDNSPARPTVETITEFGGERLISLFDETNCRVDTMITIPQPRELEVGFAENLVEVDLGSSTTLNLEINGDAPIAEIFWTQDGGAVDSAFLCSVLPCDNPTVNPLDNTTYTAFVTDANGCMSDGSITVEIDKNRNVYIPNVFAPNNAGFDTNDRFAVFTGSGVRRINYAKVFNRWGTIVADVTGVNITGVGQTIQVWDGQLKGQKANQGVYIYIVEVEFIDGQTLLYRGDIALLR